METTRATNASHRTFLERAALPFSFLAIFAYAVFTRAWGFLAPYYQDEYKWALAAGKHYGEGWIPHPFLSEFLYHWAGLFVGYAHLRIVPVIASLLVIALLFYFVRRFYGIAAGLCAAAIYAISLYALVGSLQIDIDGALLPLATIIMIGGYLLWQKGDKTERQWGIGLLVAGLCIGFALKLSFVLVPATIAADFVLRRSSIWDVLLRPLVLGGGLAIVCIAGIAAWMLYDRIEFLSYVGNFLAIGGRDYFQIFFQTAKAFVYFSPLPVLGAILGWKYRSELSIWFWFIAVSLLFYLVVFDFSHRTLDRYLMVLILPCAVISGVVLARMIGLFSEQGKARELLQWFLGSFAVLSVITGIVYALPHSVLPLIPKSAFISAFMSGHWSLLIPLTGGSGPIGFYLPLDAIAFLWGVSIVVVAGLLYFTFPTRIGRVCLAVFIAASLVYNIYATTEYLWGQHYGSSAEVTRSLLLYIEAHPEITEVITYNDIGAYELEESGVYSARFYAHPSFIPSNAEKFRKFEGFYLVVDMPQIGDSVYTEYFAGCHPKAEMTSGLISGRVLDCREAPLTPFAGY